MNALSNPATTPDQGYMCDTRRGAGMGRGTETRAGRALALQSDIESTEKTLAMFADGFEPGWYDHDRETGEVIFTPSFPTAESRAAWIKKLEADRDSSVAALARLESTAPRDKWQLQRVQLNSGGYDSGGAYWGIGAPLYCAFRQGDSHYFRSDYGYSPRDRRDTAKTYVVSNIDSTATFFR